MRVNFLSNTFTKSSTEPKNLIERKIKEMKKNITKFKIDMRGCNSSKTPIT